MIKVAKATSVGYYTDERGAASGMESYYLDAVTEGEPSGVWMGAGAAELQLSGDVDGDDMKLLYGEFVDPVTGAKFGMAPAKSETRNSVIGWDATFSVPKSVTIVHTAAHRGELAALANGDLDEVLRYRGIRVQIEDAISDANAAGIAALEDLATVRTASGSGGAMRWQGVKGLVVASFFQHTSRSIDPHLHVHNVVLNRAVSEDGKVRSLDGQDLLAQQYAFSAVADRALSEGLAARLGLEFRDRSDGLGREVSFIGTDLIEHYSTRTQQVTAALKPLVDDFTERIGREPTDLELSQLRKTAQRSSRAGKTHDRFIAAEENERWYAELVTETGQTLDAVADRLARIVDEHEARQAQQGPGPLVVSVDWNPDTVISEAIATCQERQATWGRSNLMNELELRLPVLGLKPEEVAGVLGKLTDQALESTDVVRVTGDAGAYAAPSATLYASVGTLAAETALRNAAVDRGRACLDADEVSAWLDAHAPTIGADQRAAVEGIATSDAALSVLVGPAGTGKSFTAGTLASLWEDLTDGNGRLVGLATSEVAAQVLLDDGIPASRNIARWLAAQDRLASGSTQPEDQVWAVRAGDVLMVDEASMVSTEALTRIHGIAEQAGARVVLTGDPRQLAAVEAGGVMGLLEQHAETYHLSEVRRFHAEWERGASLALRDGDPEALKVYERHGRLMGYEDLEAAQAAVAQAAVADRLGGQTSVVMTASNQSAAVLSSQIRDQLIALGQVDADGSVITGRDQNTASVGDIIMCRRNEHRLNVTNRKQYQVTATDPETGRLQVRPVTAQAAHPEAAGNEIPPAPVEAEPFWLPAGYVASDVQLAYAATVHAAEGVTVDRGHVFLDGGRIDAAGLYVATTRGRERNTVHMPLHTQADTHSAPTAKTAHGGRVEVGSETERPDARTVLEQILTADLGSGAHLPQRPAQGVAATVAAEQAAEREASMTTISARLDSETRIVCRSRTERHLDDLTAAGVLDEHTRGRLAADQGTEQLSRLLRALELAGQDPRECLTDALTGPQSRGRKKLDDAKSVAQVLSHRISNQHTLSGQLPAPTTDGSGLPADIPAADAQRLQQLHQRATERAEHLGQQAADEAPDWAVMALGPVPAPVDLPANGEEVSPELEQAAADRADWIQRAGAVAAYREASAFDDPDQALGLMPGISTTERRAAFAHAWEALGQPDAGLAATDLTEGQLRVRVRAWEREQQWAPPHVDERLQDTEETAEKARQEAILERIKADNAEAEGRTDDAEALRQAAEEHASDALYQSQVAEALTKVSDARHEWVTRTSWTYLHAAQASDEAERRGLVLEAEEDRGNGDDWLDQHQAETRADDAHRTITDHDADTVSTDDQVWAAATASDDAPHLDSAPEAPGPRAQARAAAAEAPRTAADDIDLDHVVTSANVALAVIRDRMSQENAHDRSSGQEKALESYDAGRRRRDAAELSVRPSAADLAAVSDEL